MTWRTKHRSYKNGHRGWSFALGAVEIILSPDTNRTRQEWAPVLTDKGLTEGWQDVYPLICSVWIDGVLQLPLSNPWGRRDSILAKYSSTRARTRALAKIRASWPRWLDDHPDLEAIVMAALV